jgi:hypothetical protein
MITRLNKPVEIVTAKLEQQVTVGEGLLKRYEVAALEDRANLIIDATNWHKVNDVLLAQLFDTPKYQDEYKNQTQPAIDASGFNVFMLSGRRRPVQPPAPKPAVEPQVFVKNGVRNLRSLLAIVPHLEQPAATVNPHTPARRKLDDMNLAETDRVRFQFLKNLYENTRGTDLNMIQMSDIASIVRIDEGYARDVCKYLVGEGLIKIVSGDYFISITHDGIKEVEKAERTPQQSTQHFPANVINFNGPMTGAVQVGNINSTQTATITVSTEDVQELVTWLGKLKENIPNLGLSSHDSEAMQRNLATLEGETREAEPDKGVLRTYLVRVKSLLETVAGHMVAVQLMNELPSLMHHLHA